jgi:hypothetical protein
MKNLIVVIGLFISSVLTGCLPLGGDIGKPVARYGVTAYNPPQGDPTVFRDVNIYGPGAVIRTRRAGYEAGASMLVGRDTVAGWASNPAQNSAPFGLPNIDTSSGYGIVAEGGNPTSAQVAYEIKAKLDANHKTTLNATFGPTRVLNPFGEAELRQLVSKHRSDFDSATLKNLKHGTSAIILQSYYSDGITYTFTQDGKNSLDLSGALAGKDIAKLSASGFKVNNNKLVYDKPIFIGYSPLPDVASVLNSP